MYATLRNAETAKTPYVAYRSLTETERSSHSEAAHLSSAQEVTRLLETLIPDVRRHVTGARDSERENTTERERDSAARSNHVVIPQREILTTSRKVTQVSGREEKSLTERSEGSLEERKSHRKSKKSSGRRKSGKSSFPRVGPQKSEKRRLLRDLFFGFRVKKTKKSEKNRKSSFPRVGPQKSEKRRLLRDLFFGF